MAERLYAANQQSQAGQGPAEGASEGGEHDKKGDTVMDAEFEEVKDEKKS